MQAAGQGEAPREAATSTRIVRTGVSRSGCNLWVTEDPGFMEAHRTFHSAVLTCGSGRLKGLLGTELGPSPNACVEVVTSGCGCIWRQGL